MKASEGTSKTLVGLGCAIALFAPGLLKEFGLPLLPIGNLVIVAVGAAFIVIGFKVAHRPVTLREIVGNILLSLGFMSIMGGHALSNFTELGAALALPGILLLIVGSFLL